MIMNQNFLYTPQESEMIKNTLNHLIITIKHQQNIVQGLKIECQKTIEFIKISVEKKFFNTLKNLRIDEKILKKSKKYKWIKLFRQDLNLILSVDKDYFTYFVYYSPTTNIDFMPEIKEQIKNKNIPDITAEIDKVLSEYQFIVNIEDQDLQIPIHENEDQNIYEAVKCIEKYRKYILKYQQFILMISEIKDKNMNHYITQFNQLVQEIIDKSPFREGEQNQEFNYIQNESIQYEEFIFDIKDPKQYTFSKIKDNGMLTSNYNVYKKVKATIIVNQVLKCIFVVNNFKHYKEIPTMVEKIILKNENFTVMYFRIAHPLSKNNNDRELSLLYEVLKYIRKDKNKFQKDHNFYQLIYKEQVSEFRIWLLENDNILQKDIQTIQNKIKQVFQKEIKEKDIYKYIINPDVVNKFKKLNPTNELILIINQDQIEENIKNEVETLIVQNQNKEIDKLIHRVDQKSYLMYGNVNIYHNIKLMQTIITPMLAVVAQFYLSYIDKRNVQLFKHFLELQPKGIARVIEQLNPK